MNALRFARSSLRSAARCTVGASAKQTNQLCMRTLHIPHRVLVAAPHRSCFKQNAGFLRAHRFFSSYPDHQVVPMPALSPTMEMGTISKWNLKEGDYFEAGTAICDIETDKATMSFDAQEDGYIAKILVHSGEVKVGMPLVVTVEDEADVGKFSDFSVSEATGGAVEAPAGPVATSTGERNNQVPVHAPEPVSAPTGSTNAALVPSSGDRLRASPKAKKLARDGGFDWQVVAQTLAANGGGSGPNGRVLAEDVISFLAAPPKQATASASASVSASSAAVDTPRAAAASAAASRAAAAPAGPSAASPAAAPAVAGSGVYVDFAPAAAAAGINSIFVHSKQVVPHYFLSVDLNLSKLVALRHRINAAVGEKGTKVSVFDCVVKAAAGAMKQVPDVNAAWMDSFVRQYENVDINVFMGSGSSVAAPLLRNVNSKGFGAISKEMAAFNEKMSSAEGHAELTSSISVGTFSVHDLGVFGVKSAGPIVLTPQACALSLGAIVDTVVPSRATEEGAALWAVAPQMTATLSCDHRVVDGAVGAQWLAAFKLLVEEPENMLL